jgi:hypothetical protein
VISAAKERLKYTTVGMNQERFAQKGPDILSILLNDLVKHFPVPYLRTLLLYISVHDLFMLTLGPLSCAPVSSFTITFASQNFSAGLILGSLSSEIQPMMSAIVLSESSYLSRCALPKCIVCIV